MSSVGAPIKTSLKVRLGKALHHPVVLYKWPAATIIAAACWTMEALSAGAPITTELELFTTDKAHHRPVALFELQLETMALVPSAVLAAFNAGDKLGLPRGFNFSERPFCSWKTEMCSDFVISVSNNGGHKWHGP